MNVTEHKGTVAWNDTERHGTVTLNIKEQLHGI